MGKRTQGLKNIPLTDRGREQAYRLAERLSGEGITRILTSDLDRAAQTAAIVGNQLHLNPEDNCELREVCFGAWEGLTLEEIEASFPGELKTWQHEYDFSPHCGESITDLHNRVKQFIDSTIKGIKSNQTNILVVSHGITSKVLIMELMGMPLSYLWHFKLDNTGVSIIEVEENKSTILCLNDTCHLKETHYSKNTL